MLTLNDERLMETQLLTLSGRAERFASTFLRKLALQIELPPGPTMPDRPDWLCALTRRAETPDAFLAELVLACCNRTGLVYSPELSAAIGIVLLDALQDVMGESFTGKSREAWSRAFALVSDGISEAA